MAISFNQIPSSIQTPGVFIEFDTSKASQGPAIQRHVALLVGQRLSTGSKAAGSIDLISSASQGRDFYGAGSMLSAMIDKFLAENKINEMYAIALDDNGAGVAATGSITIGGAPTVAGTLSYYIAGRRYQVPVATTDTPTTLVAALVAEITADTDKQVTAAINGGDPTIADLTYVHKGEVGNEIDIRLDSDSTLPAGLTSVIVGLSGGTSNPDVSSVITAMADVQYHEISIPYTDTTTLNTFKTEMDLRWGPMNGLDGQVYTAKKDSLSNLSTFLDGRNNEHETVAVNKAHRNGPHEWSAHLAAVCARNLQIDPARPNQTVPMGNMLAYEQTDLFTRDERNQLLVDGGSTFKSNAGTVEIERLKTTRKLDSFGAPDESLADLNPKATLSFLRFDLRARLSNRFPRHKLANDDIRPAPGQAIATPNSIRAEVIAKFIEWEQDLALVEGFSQFKNDLLVERNSSDPNRVDILMSPDLVNQLRVIGAQIAFLL